MAAVTLDAAKLKSAKTVNTTTRDVRNLMQNYFVQPVATCRQSPYFHKPAILIMTSFWLWRHSLLSWPRPAFLRTYVKYVRTAHRVQYINRH